jgi:hypothetical protein
MLDVTFYISENRCAGLGKKKHKNSKFVSILAAVSWSLSHCRLKEQASVTDHCSVSLETLLAIGLPQ